MAVCVSRSRAKSMTCLRQKLTFPGSLVRSYQNQADIHDVGVGGTGDDQIAERLEVVVGIVAVEIKAGVGLACEGLAIGNGAGSIGGAIGAIGASAEDHDAREAGDVQGGGESEFLVTAAEAIALDGDGGFAAGDDAGGGAHRAGGGGAFAGGGGGDGGGFPGFPFDGA